LPPIFYELISILRFSLDSFSFRRTRSFRVRYLWKDVEAKTLRGLVLGAFSDDLGFDFEFYYLPRVRKNSKLVAKITKKFQELAI